MLPSKLIVRTAVGHVSVVSKRYFNLSKRLLNKPIAKFVSHVDSELKAISEAGLWKHERIITTKQGILTSFSRLR